MSSFYQLCARQIKQLDEQTNKKTTHNDIKNVSDYNVESFYEKTKYAGLPGGPIGPCNIIDVKCSHFNSVDNDRELGLFVSRHSAGIKKELPNILVNKNHGDFYVGLIDYAFWNLIDCEPSEYIRKVLRLGRMWSNINIQNFSVCNQLAMLINTTIHKASLIIGNYFGIDADKCMLRSSVYPVGLSSQNTINYAGDNPAIIYGNGSVFNLEDSMTIKRRDGVIQQHILTYKNDDKYVTLYTDWKNQYGRDWLPATLPSLDKILGNTKAKILVYLESKMTRRMLKYARQSNMLDEHNVVVTGNTGLPAEIDEIDVSSFQYRNIIVCCSHSSKEWSYLEKFCKRCKDWGANSIKVYGKDTD